MEPKILLRLTQTRHCDLFLPDRSKRGLHDGTSAIKRARFLMRTLGIKCAAGFLRNRGYSCEFALYTLLGK